MISRESSSHRYVLLQSTCTIVTLPTGTLRLIMFSVQKPLINLKKSSLLISLRSGTPVMISHSSHLGLQVLEDLNINLPQKKGIRPRRQISGQLESVFTHSTIRIFLSMDKLNYKSTLKPKITLYILIRLVPNG